MTNGRVALEKESFRLELDGHATGYPEVCAAVSCLAYTLAGFLTNAEAAGDADVEALVLEPGCVRIHARGGARTEAAWEMTTIGLRQLANRYPQGLQMDVSDMRPH